MRHVKPFLAVLLSVSWMWIPISTHAQVPVSGRLLGADGRPMPEAHIVVDDGPVDTSFVVAVDADGSFSFELPAPGGYGLYLLGQYHETQEIPFIVTGKQPAELRAQLAAYEFASDLGQVQAIGDFNEFTPGPTAVPLKEQADGTFRATIETESDTLAYQLVNVRQSPSVRGAYPISGAGTDRTVFRREGPFWDAKGDYISVVDAVDGQALITLDPDQLPGSEEAFSLEARPEAVSRIVSVYLDVEARERQGLGLSDRQEYRTRIHNERDPLVKSWLLLRYFDELHPTEDDADLARMLFERVAPDSPLWSFEAWSPVGVSNILAAARRTLGEPEVAHDYVRRGAKMHPDPDVQAQFLYVGFYVADATGDAGAKEEYFNRLVREFRGTRQAERVWREYSPERKIQEGQPIPPFSFTALGDSSRTYTDEKVTGRVYLIDFWGTWCAPCIKEMPYLHEAYEKYKDEGFEILSVAMMDDKESIRQFRDERFPMPWLHTLISREEDGAVRETFEVNGFPRPILVDETGTIVAIDKQARGEALGEALSRLLE